MAAAGGTSGVTAVAATRSASERRILAHFREANATQPARAVDYVAQRPLERVVFRRLIAAQVVRRASRGGYYLDDQSYRNYREHRRRLVLITFGISLALVAFLIVIAAAGG